MTLTFKTFIGSEIIRIVKELAALRIAVFHDFPYLYAGTLEHELSYLQTYINAPNAMVFVVYDDQKMVGATTCIPLANETPEVQAPFVQAGVELSTIFYFGESILLSSYRGRGLGIQFFEEREAHAKTITGVSKTCFCAVVREPNHPSMPLGYQPLDSFWVKRGYAKQQNLISYFEWLDLGERSSTIKPMAYWSKEINR